MRLLVLDTGGFDVSVSGVVEVVEVVANVVEIGIPEDDKVVLVVEVLDVVVVGSD